MDAGLLAQYLVIALAVAASAAFIARRQFPAGVRRLRIACAIPLVRDGRAGWVQRLGRRLAPPAAPGGGNACGGCNGCD